eukprot:TRINITY_DN5344_c0_g1_i1.p1 TRINITY_DN5344_c0_g1~~TRINITY_DN5344_c0_g1_i1.p1  ORF type:complete len:224 (-),score=69.54 TRINITY_DN5344_c0_g1_i1:166-837(-)
MSAKVILGYWGFRGRGEPLRLLMEYLRIPFEDRRYRDMGTYLSDAAELKEKFPLINLPFIVDGDVVLTESQAIGYYLCQRAKRDELLGRDKAQVLKIRVIFGVCEELVLAAMQSFALQTVDQVFPVRVHPRIKDLGKYINKEGFAAGDLTIVDFFLYETITLIQFLDKTILELAPNLKDYMRRFEEIPEVKEYQASPRFRAKKFIVPPREALYLRWAPFVPKL